MHIDINVIINIFILNLLMKILIFLLIVNYDGIFIMYR